MFFPVPSACTAPSQYERRSRKKGVDDPGHLDLVGRYMLPIETPLLELEWSCSTEQGIETAQVGQGSRRSSSQIVSDGGQDARRELPFLCYLLNEHLCLQAE